jgi:hypothetical protein
MILNEWEVLTILLARHSEGEPGLDVGQASAGGQTEIRIP